MRKVIRKKGNKWGFVLEFSMNTQFWGIGFSANRYRCAPTTYYNVCIEFLCFMLEMSLRRDSDRTERP